MKTTFTTERLIASAMTRDDLYELFPIWSDPDVTKWMNIEPFETVEEARAMIDWMNDQPDTIRYTVRCEGEVLGSCGFQQMTETAAEIGYELKKSAWRQRFGTEIVDALLRLARQTEWTHVVAWIDEQNEPSIRLVERFGFTPDGTRAEDGTVRYVFRLTDPSV